MNVKIIDGCISCGLCVETCPEIFEMSGDLAVVNTEEVPPELEDLVQQAADECPVEVIIVE